MQVNGAIYKCDLCGGEYNIEAFETFGENLPKTFSISYSLSFNSTDFYLCPKCAKRLKRFLQFCS